MNTPQTSGKNASGVGTQPAKGIPYGDAWKVDTVGIVVLAALSGLAYFLGAGPLLQRHAKVQSEQIELNDARQKAAQTTLQLSDVKTQLVATRTELSSMPLRLQQSGLLNHRLALVTDLVAQGGAGLDDIQPGKPVGGTRFDALPIHVAGTGTYYTFTALLHSLRQQFPDIGLSALEVSGNPQDPAATAKFSVDLLWYTQPTRHTESGAQKDQAKAAK